MNDTETKELGLLLIRPSIAEIFSPKNIDNSPIDADVVITRYGVFDAKSLKKHMIERVPILCVNESATVGYTFPMRFDLFMCLHELADTANPPIDYPLGLFTNRDVMVFIDGMYTVVIGHHGSQKAFTAYEHGMGNFSASHLIYASTTTEEGMMNNLRRLEATAKTLLTPEPTTLPKLPPEIIDDWQHDFLEPIFKHVKERLIQKQ